MFNLLYLIVIIPISLLILYFLIIGLLLLFPSIQPFIIYFHWVRIPFVDFNSPPGIRQNQIKNFKLITQDGISIGAWHILPDDPIHKEVKVLTNSSPNSLDFEKELSQAER